LNLRFVNLELYRSLLGYKEAFSAYKSLRTLKLDLGAGVWDWDLRGSPHYGASPDFEFEDLGFPAVKSLSLSIPDFTITKSRAGPLALVNPQHLEELNLSITKW
jgi:hypothetical protein